MSSPVPEGGLSRLPAIGAMSDVPTAGSLGEGPSPIEAAKKTGLAGLAASFMSALSGSTVETPSIMWQHPSTGHRGIWLMNGTTHSSDVDLPAVAPEWSIAGGGNFNSDASPDIVWQNTVTGDRSIWLMVDNSFNQTYASLPKLSTDWLIAATADFNQDGETDLVFQNIKTGDRYIQFMNDTTYAGQQALPNVVAPWRIAAAADFNGDGMPDLVWQNPVSGDRGLWLMQRGTYAHTDVILPIVSPLWTIISAADFDGDGDPDMVWQQVDGPQHSFWIMNGAAYTGTSILLPDVPMEWRMAGTLVKPAVTSDAAAPAIASLGLAPTTVDVHNASRTVSVTATLADGNSGVGSFSATLTGAAGNPATCSATVPSSGTRANGSWTCTVTMPQGGAAGTWTLSIVATDVRGNALSLSGTGLSNRGFPSAVTVVNDTTAPAVLSVAMTPDTVNVSGAAPSVSATARLTDAGSGVKEFRFTLTPPSGSSQTCIATSLTSGSAADGTWKCSIPIAQTASTGNWSASVTALDVAGNQRVLLPADLTAAGDSAGVTVIISGIITITFDDGWKDTFTNAYPVLSDLGLKATSAVNPGPIDSLWSGYMTVKNLDSLKKVGWAIISHTYNHPHLPTISAAALDHELGDSQKWIVSHGYGPSNVVIIPFHDWGARELTAVKKYYKYARGHTIEEFSPETYTPLPITDDYAVYAHEPEYAPYTTAAGRTLTMSKVRYAVENGKYLDLMFHHIPTADVANFKLLMTQVAAYKANIRTWADVAK